MYGWGVSLDGQSLLYFGQKKNHYSIYTSRICISTMCSISPCCVWKIMYIRISLPFILLADCSYQMIYGVSLFQDYNLLSSVVLAGILVFPSSCPSFFPFLERVLSSNEAGTSPGNIQGSAVSLWCGVDDEPGP